MSKDKGGKKNKKQKAVKGAGKKTMSDYKLESKNKKDQSTLDVFAPKSNGNASRGHKKK